MSVLSSFMSGDFAGAFLKLGVTAFVVICLLPIHEFAHAFVAYKLGDQTARLSGRLTINPFAHIDLWGALMIVLVGFGYARAVPVNMRNFKNPKAGMALVALAGPVSNFLMSVVFIFLSALTLRFLDYNSTLGNAIFTCVSYAAIVNINLAIFNFLPIPPLDGSRIISVILPDRIYYKIMQYERYILIGLFLLMVLPATDFIWSGLSSLSYAIYEGLLRLMLAPMM